VSGRFFSSEIFGHLKHRGGDRFVKRKKEKNFCD
jgi:hypothetical protein